MAKQSPRENLDYAYWRAEQKKKKQRAGEPRPATDEERQRAELNPTQRISVGYARNGRKNR